VAQVLGQDFKTPAQFCSAKLPRQGGTNITAGLEAALEIMKENEMKEEESAGQRTHHVLVLLSDGKHNRGPKPTDQLPGIGANLRENFSMLRLSVVVVGVTANSDTSMGMLMKHTLESVALPALEPIYFASTPTMMGEVLSQMHQGLAALRGSVLTIHAPLGCTFVRAVGDAGVSSMDLLVERSEQTLLCLAPQPPEHVMVDGYKVQCASPPQNPAELDIEFETAALQQLLDSVRLRRVAVGADGVTVALQQLRTWISALEKLAAEQRAATGGIELCLARATPSQRLAQHRALKRTTQGAKELLNQLAEIEAHSSNDSASQAAFLVGAKSKYGAKALVRAAAHGNASDPACRLRELVSDLTAIAPKMRSALREDFCSKLSSLDSATRESVRERLSTSMAVSDANSTIEHLCAGSITVEAFETDAKLAELVDSGTAMEALLEVIGRPQSSYLSLMSAWEQLQEWCNASAAITSCTTEYQLLMCLGALGYPIDVQRRAATQMDPYAMEITRIRASIVDTPSLSTALHSDQSVFPPEGGVPIEDVLVLVDPDMPRASRLAASSTLLKEAYTSVVLCRDLHMFTGNKMRIALHAHSLFAAVQAPPTKPCKEDVVAQLQRQYLGRAFQCAQCSFGPIDHFACGDLEAHHGEDVGGAVINNACPRCSWFSDSLSDWPKWDGTVPKEALEQDTHLPVSNGTAFMTAASVELALRICYSARAIWQTGDGSEAYTLCEKLANWESLTAADGVDHPVQLLLALAVVDDLSDAALGFTPVLQLLNEVCARHARNELRQQAGTDEPSVIAAAHKRVAGFLGVTRASAPETRPLEESEPKREAIMESCCGDYSLDTSQFNFKEWVRDVLEPWLPALIFVQRLREALTRREGGWKQLARDMEMGPDSYADVVQLMQKPLCSKESLRSILGIEKQSEAPRILATIVGQAFLHQSSQQRRTTVAGGNLQEPLGDVRDSNTLRALCVDLRMVIYEERVAAKMREWGRLGTSLTCQRARAVDLNEYSHMCGSHVHGLDKQTFWGLWNAASGQKAKEFLCRANQGFVAKHGGR